MKKNLKVCLFLQYLPRKEITAKKDKENNNPNNEPWQRQDRKRVKMIVYRCTPELHTEDKKETEEEREKISQEWPRIKYVEIRIWLRKSFPKPYWKSLHCCILCIVLWCSASGHLSQITTVHAAYFTLRKEHILFQEISVSEKLPYYFFWYRTKQV